LPYHVTAGNAVNMKTITEQQDDGPGMIALSVWLARMGRSDTTGWRWARNGWIHPINISGKNYINQDDRVQFEARAARGEFAKKPSGAAKEKSNSVVSSN
jgi:hypothetical protein